MSERALGTGALSTDLEQEVTGVRRWGDAAEGLEGMRELGSRKKRSEKTKRIQAVEPNKRDPVKVT